MIWSDHADLRHRVVLPRLISAPATSTISPLCSPLLRMPRHRAHGLDHAGLRWLAPSALVSVLLAISLTDALICRCRGIALALARPGGLPFACSRSCERFSTSRRHPARRRTSPGRWMRIASSCERAGRGPLRGCRCGVRGGPRRGRGYPREPLERPADVQLVIGFAVVRPARPPARAGPPIMPPSRPDTRKARIAAPTARAQIVIRFCRAGLRPAVAG